MIQAMNKDLRALTLRMQKFRKVIQAFNVCISFVPGIHNKISNALSRAPVVGPEGTERVLSNLRGHASYAYNRIVSCITGDISQEVIEDPALDDMWDAAREDMGYKEVANLIEGKADVDRTKTMNSTAVKEYIGQGLERMFLIRKEGVNIILMDQTRIVVPRAMRETLLAREHLTHSEHTKMGNSIMVKYFRPGMDRDVKKTVEASIPCQKHGPSQQREPNRPALKYLDRPMMSVGIDFFQRRGYHHLLLKDHFLGLPMFKKMHRTDAEYMIRQMKSWFSLFRVARMVRSNNGPTFSSKAFKNFCDEYGIELHLCLPINPNSLRAIERGVGLVKAILKKTDEEGSCFEEPFAAFKNARNDSGYSPNQLFFLHN